MPTNYEWLLHMNGEERQAWFDAEHVDAQSKPHSKTEQMLTEQSESLSDANDDLAPESDVTADAVDANDENATQDSREKLKTEIYNHVVISMSNKDKDGVLAPYATVIGWLDRQAEITRKTEQASWIQQANGLIHQANVRGDELQAKVDELRDELAKRDKGIARLKRQRDTARAKIDELHAECDTCCYKTDYIEMDFCDVDRLEAERDALATDLRDCEQQRERLRQALGRAIDHAHEITRLVDIDGELMKEGGDD